MNSIPKRRPRIKRFMTTGAVDQVQHAAGKVRRTVLSWAQRDSQVKAVCFGNLLSVLAIGIIYISYALLYPYIESVFWALLLVIDCVAVLNDIKKIKFTRPIPHLKRGIHLDFEHNRNLDNIFSHTRPLI